MKIISIILLILFSSIHFAYADAEPEKVLNLYLWSDEVPTSILKQFERETGIKVNYASYDSNEELYAKIKAAGNPGYDVIEPSSYYLTMMRDEDLLLPIDKTRLSLYGNLDPAFLNQSYDPHSAYDIPYFWTASGIFYNTRYFAKPPATAWADLWSPAFRDQLLLVNDVRDIFAVAFEVLNYSINSNNPNEIKAAYEKLVALLPNIKLFNSEAAVIIAVDEDATVGLMWSGDFIRASQNNPNLRFIYPSDGYAISVDCFAIPVGAPHPENAYLFLNFMLRPEIAAKAGMTEGYGIANLAARQLMPAALRNQHAMYPTPAEMARGQFELGLTPATLALYTHYWQLLKMQ